MSRCTKSVSFVSTGLILFYALEVIGRLNPALVAKNSHFDTSIDGFFPAFVIDPKLNNVAILDLVRF